MHLETTHDQLNPNSTTSRLSDHADVATIHVANCTIFNYPCSGLSSSTETATLKYQLLLGVDSVIFVAFVLEVHEVDKEHGRQ